MTGPLNDHYRLVHGNLAQYGGVSPWIPGTDLTFQISNVSYRSLAVTLTPEEGADLFSDEEFTVKPKKRSASKENYVPVSDQLFIDLAKRAVPEEGDFALKEERREAREIEKQPAKDDIMNRVLEELYLANQEKARKASVEEKAEKHSKHSMWKCISLIASIVGAIFAAVGIIGVACAITYTSPLLLTASILLTGAGLFTAGAGYFLKKHHERLMNNLI